MSLLRKSRSTYLLSAVYQFSVEEIKLLRAEAFDLKFAALSADKIIFDQLVCAFADRDLHWLGEGLHAGGHVHTGAKNVVDIFLNTDQGAHHRPGVDPNPALPFFCMGGIALLDIAQHTQGNPSNVLSVVGRWLR